MKQLQLTLVGLLLLVTSATACDVCGCNISNNGTGILAAYRYNTIGMRWYNNIFQQSPDYGNTKDYFQTLEFAAQFHPTDRLRLSIFQPIKWHQQFGENEVQDASLFGLGDTRLMANYALLQNVRVVGASTLYWEVGGGMKLPTGAYDDRIHLRDLPENFNIGNASWGYIAQSTLVYNTLDVGLVLNGSYQHHQAARTDYQFGDQLTANVMVFAQKSFTKKWRTVPFGGIYYEQVQVDRLYNDRAAHGTGGKGWFASTGVNFIFDQWLVSATYTHPFQQSYTDDEMIAKPRMAVELNYVF
ncbi:MAG: hypothetical protein AAGI23_11495 [Bacteroidota bacterium]